MHVLEPETRVRWIYSQDVDSKRFSFAVLRPCINFPLQSLRIHSFITAFGGSINSYDVILKHLLKQLNEKLCN